MKRTLWQVQPMLDAPFCSGWIVWTQIDGVESVDVHEALDPDSFARPLLKFMRPVRMRKRSGSTRK